MSASSGASSPNDKRPCESIDNPDPKRIKSDWKVDEKEVDRYDLSTGMADITFIAKDGERVGLSRWLLSSTNSDYFNSIFQNTTENKELHTEEEAETLRILFYFIEYKVVNTFASSLYVG